MRWARPLVLIALAALARCECADNIGFDPLQGRLAADPAALSFATYVGGRQTRVVRLTNGGDAAAPLTSVTVEGNAFSLVPVEAEVVPAGTTLELTVAFTPTEAGSSAGTLRVRADAQEGAELDVPLGGEAVEAPACEAPGPCVEVSFDPDAGGCVQTFLEGACDDGNACTADGVCVSGQCLGTAVVCEEPAVACFVGLCDAEVGCTTLPVNEQCDDGDPCTDDVCTPAGCTNPPADDGTPCGTFSCATSSLCFSGTCQEFATPDGVPCSDGNACTSADICSEGECVGSAYSGDAEVIGRTDVFGAANAVSVVLDDGRVVVRDVGLTGRTEIFTVLSPSGAELVLETQVHFDASVDDDDFVFTTSIAPLGTDGFALLRMDGLLRVFAVTAGGVEERATLDTGVSDTYAQRPMVAISDTEVALCGAQGLGVATAWPPDEASIGELLQTAGDCMDLAWDPKAGRLYLLLESQQLMTWSPGDDVIMPSTFPNWAVAANGDLVALAVASDLEILDTLPRRVALFDPESFELLGEVDPPVGGGAIGQVVDLWLTDRWLFVAAANVFSVYDVTDPAAPVLLLAESESAPNNRAPNVLLGNDDVVVRNAHSPAYSALPRLMDVTGDSPVELHHPRRGGMRRIEVVDGRPYTLHPTATHILDLTSPTSPLITDGGWRALRGDSLVALRIYGIGPHFGVGPRRNPTVNGTTALLWTNETMPADALPLGAIDGPFDSGVVTFDSDGRYAFAARMSTDDEAFFEVYDTHLFQPNTGAPAGARVVSLALDLPGADRNTWSQVSFDGDRVVFVMQQDWEFDTAPADLASEVVLFDIVSPQDPAALASASLPGLVRQGRAAGDVVLAVRRTSGGWFNTAFEGEDLVRLVVDEGVLRLDATAPLARGGDILWMDDTHAIVRTELGLAFVSHADATVTIESELALPYPVTDAEVTPETTWLVGENGVVAVRPPCP